MSRRVFVRPSAEADLRAARNWYENQRPGLGEAFLLAITETLLHLEEAAESVPFYYRDFRRLLTDRFPYKIFFRIEHGGVIVFRVLHAARDHVSELR